MRGGWNPVPLSLGRGERGEGMPYRVNRMVYSLNNGVASKMQAT